MLLKLDLFCFLLNISFFCLCFILSSPFLLFLLTVLCLIYVYSTHPLFFILLQYGLYLISLFFNSLVFLLFSPFSSLCQSSLYMPFSCLIAVSSSTPTCLLHYSDVYLLCLLFPPPAWAFHRKVNGQAKSAFHLDFADNCINDSYSGWWSGIDVISEGKWMCMCEYVYIYMYGHEVRGHLVLISLLQMLKFSLKECLFYFQTHILLFT